MGKSFGVYFYFLSCRNLFGIAISKLSSYFLLPIKLESKRKQIYRFLNLKELSLPLFWFPKVYDYAPKFIQN